MQIYHTTSQQLDGLLDSIVQICHITRPHTRTVAEVYIHHELKRFKIIQKVPCHIKYMGDKRTQNSRIIKITSSYNSRGLGTSNQFSTDFKEYDFSLAFSRIYSRLTGHVIALLYNYMANTYRISQNVN